MLQPFLSACYISELKSKRKRSDQISAAAQAASSVSDWLSQIVQSTELNSVYVRGTFEYESLNREEKNRFTLLIMHLLRSAESVWQYQKIGVIDPEYWDSIESTVERIVGTAGATRCYKHNRETLSAGFANVVDDILSRAEHSNMGSTD